MRSSKIQLALIRGLFPVLACLLPWTVQAGAAPTACRVAVGNLLAALDVPVNADTGRILLAERLGIPLEAMPEAKVGGMNVAAELRTPAGAAQPQRFPASAKIPPALQGQEVDGWMVKLEKSSASGAMSDPQRKLKAQFHQAREEVAIRELPEATAKLRSEGYAIDFVETHAVFGEDGSRILFQRKAPGRKVTEVVDTLFGDAFKTGRDLPTQKALVRALSDPGTLPCFNVSIAVAALSEPCRKVMNLGIDTAAVGAVLKKPAGENLVKNLRGLRALAENKGGLLPKLTTATKNVSLANRMFWSETRGPVLVLDMSVENFMIDEAGDQMKIHIFDP